MPNIGETIGGGTLFYSGATYGLVAANNDIYTDVYWGTFGTEVLGTGTGLGTGQANTTAIIATFTGFTAAKACDDFVSGGFGDWYLPSSEELDYLYFSGSTYISNLNIYNNYWSSSQSTPYTAHMQYFLNGVKSDKGYKNVAYAVRPIRTY